jgi:NADPH-dependent curcumin reductase CurA
VARSYAPAYEIGKPISNSAVCKVLKSANGKLKEGDVVVVGVDTAVNKIDNKHYGIGLSDEGSGFS